MTTRVVDGRDLIPPEPLELTLAALEESGEDDDVVLLLYRQPFPLYNILRQDGYCWEENLLDDGTWEIRIRKAPHGA